MVARFERNARNPLLVPEIVGLVINNIYNVPYLLNCAGVNSIWNVAALKKLYKGSLDDMQFRTPDIGSLNCPFVASRKQFARNMSFVKHLLLSPERPAIDEVEGPHTRLVCLEKCRAMRHRQYAEYLLQPRGRVLSSLTIPFEIKDQDWSLFPDILINPTIEFLAIDSYYCKLIVSSQEFIKASVSLVCWGAPIIPSTTTKSQGNGAGRNFMAKPEGLVYSRGGGRLVGSITRIRETSNPQLGKS
ncbi:hypothetical protein BDV37DRAFT_242526 [Aspergillus pseudonomiae]|uniref:Uncharacterized protein n=1 Tax=Aspergillus pseudonomiae TaxID=1506151 RepID=A0A5N7DLB8_9EURO|nr:uncharacterized protein BDV37DRAFT_242526 [Aspergillus pseudonomiae]KAE8406773.1 hypothetical protein BDV37DRAFT_242526 [Aspergillus pseudonomiae]